MQPVGMPVTAEESKRFSKQYLQLNLLGFLVSSSNYKRIIRLAKIVVKRGGEHYKKIEAAVEAFETKYMPVEKTQNFLSTGLLWFETEGNMYSRDELDRAMEDLIEYAVDIANNHLEEEMSSSDVGEKVL